MSDSNKVVASLVALRFNADTNIFKKKLGPLRVSAPVRVLTSPE